MSTVYALPSDSAARERIRHGLDESLLVEASAGTGKTTEMVARMVNVLRSGRTTIDQIAAVTFTHKAAGEMKLRLRQELDRARTQEVGRDHLEHALQHLEEASIGTIHAFCAQILRERPVEARVDPAFAEVTDYQRDRLYSRAFRGWIQSRLQEDSPGVRRALSRLAWAKYPDRSPLDALRFAAIELVEWRDFRAPWTRVPFDRPGAIDQIVGHVLAVGPQVNQGFAAVRELATGIARADEIGKRDYDALEAQLIKLHRDLTYKKGKGIEDLMAALASFKTCADADLAAELKEELAGFVDRYEELKRQAGQLDFLDQLLLTRDLVRNNRQVRAYLQKRFSHIFVDEFQDTDPLQAEIILLLAADNADEADWMQARPVDGKLFVVGDPKQSIYKFRRADVLLYQKLRRNLLERGVGVVQLTRSFRSVQPLQEFVNAAFALEMNGDETTGQASYAPLLQGEPHEAVQPAVVALPVPRIYGMRDVSRKVVAESEPEVVVAFTDWLLRESGWTVRDPEDRRKRIPIRERHICLLFRRLTNFGVDISREYTRRFEARGISHLLVGSKSFHRREEIESLRAALTAIEWPDDELSLYATLRGSLFAISDALLLKFRHQHRSLNPFQPRASIDTEFAPIVAALDLLQELHRKRNWRPVADTLNRLLEATRAHAGFAFRPAGHQVLANVARLADLARGYELEGGISFRGFVERLEEQAERSTEVSEAAVLEEGSEGVRLMTTHAAKGLEFPVVILADLTAGLARHQPQRFVDNEKQLCANELLGCTPMELYSEKIREQARERAEGVRVAYVAATRAKDLLILPVVGEQEMEGWLEPLNKAVYPPRPAWRTARRAEGCPQFGASSVLERPPEQSGMGETSVKPGLHSPRVGTHEVVWWDPAVLNREFDADYGLRQQQLLGEGGVDSLAPYQEWRDEREKLLAEASRPSDRVVTASEELDLPPAFTGEIETLMEERAPRPYGPRFGNLVHAVLSQVDLRATPETIILETGLHARILGADEDEALAAANAVRNALQHPYLEQARQARRLHREWPVSWRAAGRLLEGRIDLAFLDERGWTIIDFKTTADLTLHRRRYATQLAWYVAAVETLTGQAARGVLLGV
ncbi:MAG: UvrD-helicase domain-containing protein [Bryobacteraceae bacterium]|nr:UvrD-helicase domain-containing protein [Bryobacteraceae bacterium]